MINDAVFLGRRGFTNGPSGISIGGRPWLQKIAALTVAVSLTIATADTFKAAERQYNDGFMDAGKIQDQVEDATELKIIRVISGFFLWLAQAQTLIRLFPRQREKIIIKWTAFALISLDVLFNVLNNFVYDGSPRPRTFVDAVPALAYLFELALSLLYAAWVMYYAITKKQYAFYHPNMSNMPVVAVLSMVAIAVPIVFFVLDVSKPTLAGWGDYVRWVGAAAASVIVWEWVERIEALERNDKKDGVLGREVFDGDEMLDITPSLDSDRGGKRNSRGGGGASTGTSGRSWPMVSGIAKRYRPHTAPDVEANQPPKPQTYRPLHGLPLWPRRPAPAATPISRADTTSADSTVYAVRYHPISESTSTTPPERNSSIVPTREDSSRSPAPIILEKDDAERTDTSENVGARDSRNMESRDQGHHTVVKHHESTWGTLSRMNPFRRGVDAPPAEVSAAARPEDNVSRHVVTYGWDIRARLEDFAVTQADKFRERKRPQINAEPLPVTVIPAPPRRRNLADVLEDLEESEGDSTIRKPAMTFEGNPNTNTVNVDEQSPRHRPTEGDELRSRELDDMAITSAPPRWSPNEAD